MNKEYITTDSIIPLSELKDLSELEDKSVNKNINFDKINASFIPHVSETVFFNFSAIIIFIIYIISIIWILLGIAAWIMSIYCFKYGVNKDSIVGSIIAFVPIFLGPLYWIYYIWNSNYCKYAIIPNSIQNTTLSSYN